MVKAVVQNKPNPLTGFMRQPKIYIKLPSNGEFWPQGTLDLPDNGELPVYSMTAKDELMFKTPDALLNGQSIVDVIQSCLPNIKNAWECPSIDLDTILIAIRIATYGEIMSIKHKIPVIDEEVEYDFDLRHVLSQQSRNKWIEQVAISEDLIVFVRPLTYRHMTKTSIKTFETSRLLNTINDEKLSDEEKLKFFNESFGRLTAITIDLLLESIVEIHIKQGIVDQKEFIVDWINNVDKAVFEKIQKHVAELKKHNELQSLEFTTTEEQQELGAPAVYQIPLNFNNSDFFEQGF